MARDAGTEAGNEGADSGAEDSDAGAHHSDASEEFSSRIAEKYAEQDAKAEKEDDGTEDSESSDADEDAGADDDSEGEVDGDADDDATEDDETTESDQTDDEPDGDDAESDEDSAEGDDDESTDDESDSSDDADEDAEGKDGDKKDKGAAGKKKDGDDDEVDEDVSDEFKDAAGRHGIPLSLDDIKDPVAKQVVQRRMAQMESGFTKAMQESRAFRKEKEEFEADRRYQKENPELLITELLIQGGEDLFEKINARMAKLADADQLEAFKVVVKDKRRTTRDTVATELRVADHQDTRAATVESIARREAARHGIPFRLAERAVVQAMRKDAKTGLIDIADEDVKSVIADEARAYKKDLRSGVRDESRNRVKDKTAAKKKLPPTGRAGASSAQSPRPAAAKRPKVNHDDDESRLAAMSRSADRILAKRGS